MANQLEKDEQIFIIMSMAENHENSITSFLRLYGWVSDDSLSHGVTLWVKTINGRSVMLSMRGAYALECTIKETI